jgi:leucyl-tRNA synthetase
MIKLKKNQGYKIIDYSKEKKLQSFWIKKKIFHAKDRLNLKPFYILNMFPYPSGKGLHIGHAFGYTISDVLAKYKKLMGYNVLNPIGWDSFGLPAEQHSIKTGIHPRINTKNNIKNFKNQIIKMGIGFDWDREINTSDSNYYKWTQWIFLKIFKHGLAYFKKKSVWWCEELKTVLSNEEVQDYKTRKDKLIIKKKKIRQWILKITSYANKLLYGLNYLDWPESTKKQQKDWIGKKNKIKVKFKIKKNNQIIFIKSFISKKKFFFIPNIICIIISPFFSKISLLINKEKAYIVKKYVNSINKSKNFKSKFNTLEFFTGSYAKNSFFKERIPIWVTSSHPKLKNDKLESVILIHSNSKWYKNFLIRNKVSKNNKDFKILLNSNNKITLKEKILKQKNLKTIKTYNLKDWIFSRQRYWGEPIPIIWIKEKHYNILINIKNSEILSYLPKIPISFLSFKKQTKYFAVPIIDKFLPIKISKFPNFYKQKKLNLTSSCFIENCEKIFLNLKTGEINFKNNLKNNNKKEKNYWVLGYKEFNTMPQWAGSCWYYIRYMDPNNKNKIVSKKLEKYWKGPDLYIGGSEHSVLHLLYSRFWHIFLKKIKVINSKEPFKKLFHQGIILGRDGLKMSKSKGNVVNPLYLIKKYGSDTLRIFLMFEGSLNKKRKWNLIGIKSIQKFLFKIQNFFKKQINLQKKNKNNKNVFQLSNKHKFIINSLIKKITESIESLKFNVAISGIMSFFTFLKKINQKIPIHLLSIFITLVSPFAPHISELIWNKIRKYNIKKIGKEKSIFSEIQWPKYNSKYIKNKIKIVVQVNGKKKLIVDNYILQKITDFNNQYNLINKNFLIILLKKHHKTRYLFEKKIFKCKKIIYVPNKIINFYGKKIDI